MQIFVTNSSRLSHKTNECKRSNEITLVKSLFEDNAHGDGQLVKLYIDMIGATNCSSIVSL